MTRAHHRSYSWTRLHGRQTEETSTNKLLNIAVKKKAQFYVCSKNDQKKWYSSESFEAFLAGTVDSMTVLVKASTRQWLIGSVHCCVRMFSFQLCKTQRPDTTNVYLVLQIHSNMHMLSRFPLPTANGVCKWSLFQYLHNPAHAVNCGSQFIDSSTMHWFCSQHTKLIRTNVWGHHVWQCRVLQSWLHAKCMPQCTTNVGSR